MADTTGSTERKAAAHHIAELKELVVGYAKQETVDPLKTLGRYLGFGLGGATLIGIGCFFLLLSLLRGLQSINALSGRGFISLVPYGATLVVGLAMVGLAAYRMTRPDHRELPAARPSTDPKELTR